MPPRWVKDAPEHLLGQHVPRVLTQHRRDLRKLQNMARNSRTGYGRFGPIMGVLRGLYLSGCRTLRSLQSLFNVTGQSLFSQTGFG